MDYQGLRVLKWVMLPSFMVWLACAQPPKADSESEPVSVPANFRLAISEGGGFSGQWQGYIVQADGRVYRWQGRFGSADSQLVGQLSPEQLRALWKDIQSHNLLSVQLESPGNLSRKVEITLDRNTHRLIWSPGGTQHPDLPRVDSFYDSCMKRIEAAQKAQ